MRFVGKNLPSILRSNSVYHRLTPIRNLNPYAAILGIRIRTIDHSWYWFYPDPICEICGENQGLGFGCGSAAPGSSAVKTRVLSFHLDFDAADPLGDKIVDQGAERPKHKSHRSIDNRNEDGEAGTESQ